MLDSQQKQIDFFIAGVQKGGTTALAAYLGRHASIVQPKRKEFHFFDNDNRNWSSPDLGTIANFYGDKSQLWFDATPSYSYWPEALERIAAYNPSARMIMLLRHPTFRAYSHWRMESQRKQEDLSFSNAISTAGRQRMGGRPHLVYSYVERGFYADQVCRMLALFPRDNLLFLRTDNMWADLPGTLEKVENFLSLENTVSATAKREYIVPVPAGSAETIGKHERVYLDELYTSDILETASHTGLELADWVNPDYAEPMSE